MRRRMTHLVWSFLVEAEMNIFTPVFNPDRSIAHLVLVKGDGDGAVRSHSWHTDIQGSLQKNVCKIEKLLAGLNHLIKYEVESNTFIESKIKMALCIQGANIRNSSSLNICILYSAVWLGLPTWTKHNFCFTLPPSPSWPQWCGWSWNGSAATWPAGHGTGPPCACSLRLARMPCTMEGKGENFFEIRQKIMSLYVNL